jgi:hypothetical protein
MAGTYLSFIDISYDVLLEAYVDIMVHAFFMWIDIHIWDSSFCGIGAW